jgi:hypothetical protein
VLEIIAAAGLQNNLRVTEKFQSYFSPKMKKIHLTRAEIKINSLRFEAGKTKYVKWIFEFSPMLFFPR